MNANDIKNLKKVEKAAPSSAAERLAKLNPRAALPPAGGEASGTAEKPGLPLAKEAAEAAEKYPDVCVACGAPSGPGGCSLDFLAGTRETETECQKLAALSF